MGNIYEATDVLVATSMQRVSLPTGILEVKVDSCAFKQDDLIEFAARNNNRRGFHFLSKVIGKHWPVAPHLMLTIHEYLASRIPHEMPQPVVFIAMAETGIGLGQGVFEAYKASHPQCEALFLHSTRYHLKGETCIEFSETHSHAPRHFLHLPSQAAFKKILMSARSLVLVDDEASTGNTFENLTLAVRKLNHNIEHIHLAVITNFMGASANQCLSKRFEATVTWGAALNGEYSFRAGKMQEATSKAQLFIANIDRGASHAFGRMGLHRPISQPAALAERLNATIDSHHRVLVLGTGEFLHMAFLLAKSLETLGVSVVVQSTTRSPILNWGAVSNTLELPDNYAEGIKNYLYNFFPEDYDHIFICHETPPNEALTHLAKTVGGRLFHFLSEHQIEEIPVR